MIKRCISAPHGSDIALDRRLHIEKGMGELHGCNQVVIKEDQRHVRISVNTHWAILLQKAPFARRISSGSAASDSATTVEVLELFYGLKSISPTAGWDWSFLPKVDIKPTCS